MLNATVAQKSAWKAFISTVTIVLVALGVAIASTVADFFLNTELLKTLMSENLWVVIPLLNLAGQFIRDYAKHA